MIGAISTENVMPLFANDGPLYGKIHGENGQLPFFGKLNIRLSSF